MNRRPAAVASRGRWLVSVGPPGRVLASPKFDLDGEWDFESRLFPGRGHKDTRDCGFAVGDKMTLFEYADAGRCLRPWDAPKRYKFCSDSVLCSGGART